jgi:hypothetical protein
MRAGTFPTIWASLPAQTERLDLAQQSLRGLLTLAHVGISPDRVSSQKQETPPNAVAERIMQGALQRFVIITTLLLGAAIMGDASDGSVRSEGQCQG